MRMDSLKRLSHSKVKSRQFGLIFILVVLSTQLFTLPYLSAANLETASLDAEEYVVMDFEDSVLHDEAWLLSQPIDTVDFFVGPKNGGGTNILSLGIGEGRNGGNALRVESHNTEMGLPGFWLFKSRNAGSYAARLYDTSAYMLPWGQRANRMSFWVRFDSGYRYNNGAAQPPQYPNHNNFEFDTYHFDPNKIGVSSGNGVVESDNWHFYHQIYLRHDKADGEWMHVVLNQFPQHQRSINALPPNNSTRPGGNYWEILTRFYIEGKSYFADPEISYPFTMWIDDIKFSYVNETPEIDITFIGFPTGQEIEVLKNVSRDFNIRIRNINNTQTCGEIANTAMYRLRDVLIDATTLDEIEGSFCLAALETRDYILRITPDDVITEGRTYNLGVAFAADSQILSDAESTARSFSDGNVERRADPLGSHDAVVSGDFIRVVVVTQFSSIFADGFEGIAGGGQAPVRSDGSPSGELLAGTTSATLSLSTDQIASCRYTTIPDTPYMSMADTFTETANTSHSSTIKGLIDGTSYSYYIRCIDEAGNLNTNDYLISFSVASTTPPAQLGDYWLFYGDSQTGGRADEVYTKSHATAFEAIWSSAIGAVPRTHVNGVGGASLYATSVRYGNRYDRDVATFVHFQESGTQAREGQYTATEFAQTFEDFVRRIVAESPNAVISTETAFSFLADERWVPYNDAMRLKIDLLAQEGITVYVAEVDRNIKELIAQTSFYAVALVDGTHYTGLGNFMIAVSIYDALGFDVTTLDLSGVPDDEVSLINKQLVIDIVSAAAMGL